MQPARPYSLKQRIFHAGAWTVAGYGVSQVIRFGSNLLMTRLLVPEMFGVVAMATMVMVGLALFSDLGLRQSVVQSRRGDDAAFLNTAWVTQIARGVLLWFLALCGTLAIFITGHAGVFPAASAYADPTLPYVLAILSMTALIAGFESTKLFEASRNLAFERVTKIDVIAQLVGLFFMLGWVWIDRSIWALVSGNIFSALVRTILSHVSLPGVANHWTWDKAVFRELVHFGKWIFLASGLGFLVANGDRLLLGGLVNATMLGVYIIAFSMSSTVEQILTKIIAEVSFPAVSEIARERPHDLKSRYYRFHVALASCAYFGGGFLMIAGQAVITLLYDPRYTDAGWMLQILAVALLTIPFRIVTQCFLAIGQPQTLSFLHAIRLVALFVLTPIGFRFFGLPGALWGIVLAYFSPLPSTVSYAVKYGLFDLRKELLLLPVIFVGMAIGKAFSVCVGN